MNPNDIHGMALALGLPSALAQIEAVKQLVAEAVANEREACAQFIEDGYVRQFYQPWRKDLAAAIRARGKHEAI
jgi:hypothetical protein